jgi:hypothetical protein
LCCKTPIARFQLSDWGCDIRPILGVILVCGYKIFMFLLYRILDKKTMLMARIYFAPRTTTVFSNQEMSPK